jgi:RNA polymerase sigma factor (sigma-70 family)
VTDDERNRLAEQALPDAYRIADILSRGKGRELGEVAHDAATDAALRAPYAYDPTRGDWLAFAAVYVTKRVRVAIQRAAKRRRKRPKVESLTDLNDPGRLSRDEAGPFGISPDLNDLPPELRDAVRLVYLDGYTQIEAAERLGICRNTLTKRLEWAANILTNAR